MRDFAAVAALLVSAACAILCWTPGSTASRGFDISLETCGEIDLGTFQCLKGQYDFAVIQSMQGGVVQIGNIDNCLRWAYESGFSQVDQYLFMCPFCANMGNPTTVVKRLVSYLKSKRSAFLGQGTFWIDVEQCDGCWHTDLSQNADYVREAVDALRAAGQKVGIYSYVKSWHDTVGDAVIAPDLPLWVANYDHNPCVSCGFAPFGGWSAPTRKQFDGGASVCGITVDDDSA